MQFGDLGVAHGRTSVEVAADSEQRVVASAKVAGGLLLEAGSHVVNRGEAHPDNVGAAADLSVEAFV